MASQVSPGVVVNEFDFSDYAERIATAIFGVVGWANRGVVNRATLVTNERQLVDTFGYPPPPLSSTAILQVPIPGQLEYIAEGLVTPALHYLREGNQCIVVRVQAVSSPAVTAFGYLENSTPAHCLKISAVSPGSWPNALSVNPPNNSGRNVQFQVTNGSKLGTYWKLSIVELGIVREVFDNLTNIDDHPTDTDNFPETRINGISQFVIVEYLAGMGRPVNMGYTGFPLTGGVSGTDGKPTDPGDFFSATQDAVGLDLFRATDTVDVNLLATPGVNTLLSDDTAVVAREGIDVAASRGDALFLIDPPIAANTVASILAFANGTSPYSNAFDDSYAALYWPWVKIYDAHNQLPVWTPPCGLVAGVMAFNDRVAESWFAPAGFNRGKVRNALDVQHNASLGEREQLYASGQIVNPIVNFSGIGITVWGQKTAQRKNTALNRVNVRRMLNFAKKVIATSVKFLVFEPNDRRTWKRFIQITTPPLRSIQGRRGLFDFRVICDETTNTPTLIDQNQMRGIILMKPTKTAEVISVDFTLLSTGAQFNEFLEG